MRCCGRGRDPARAGSWGSPAAAASPGCGSWRPGCAAAAVGEIQRGRDPGDHRRQLRHLGADPGVLGALLRPWERSSAAGILGITGSSCVFLGADPAPWRPAVAAAEIQRGRDPGDHRRQLLHLAADPDALAAVRGRCGDPARAGSGRSPAAAASSWVQIRTPWRPSVAAAEIQRRRDPGDHRQQPLHLGADPAPWRPAVAAAAVGEIRRRPGSWGSPAAAASPGCGSGRPGGRLTAAAEIQRGRDPGDHRQQPLHLGADPDALGALLRPWERSSAAGITCADRVRGLCG